MSTIDHDILSAEEKAKALNVVNLIKQIRDRKIKGITFADGSKHKIYLVKDDSVAINDVIADKNVVTKIMNNSTGLQRIELNGFAKRHWQTVYHPFAYGWCLGLC